MKTHENRIGNMDWQKADARVLGRILAAQNIEFVLPDTTRIAEFFAETLITIPGISSCRVCLQGVSIQKGEMAYEICSGCPVLAAESTQPKDSPLSGTDLACRVADQFGLQFNPIRSLYHHFGFFVFQINDLDTFNLYKPFIGNLSNYVAISLENRLQRDLLQDAYSQLELRVAERTKELHTSNETIRDLYNNAPCGYHSLDKDGFYILINDTELRWLGYSRAEMVGQITFRSLLSEDSQKTFDANFPSFKEHGQVADLEFEMVRKDGSILPVLLSATVIRDKNGDYVMSRSTMFDMTERKAIERKQKDSDTRLRLTLESTQIGIWEWDVETDHMQASPTYYTLLGQEPRAEQNDRDEWLEQVHPHDRAYVRQKIQEVLSNRNANYQYEARLRHADGTYRWQQVKGVGIERTPDGKVTRMLGIMIDIDERKRVEDIRQARLRLLEFSSSHTMEELLTATLDEIEALTGSTIGFYHFLEADQKTLLLQNWSTNTLKNMCTAQGKGSHYDVASAGVWVDCVTARRPVIHNDYASLPHRKGMPDGHALVAREVVVPIFRGNQIQAIIGVGNKATDYNQNDIEVVSQLGDLSWDVAERMRVEENLRQANERFSLAARTAHLGVWDWDIQKDELIWDNGMYELYGVKREDFAGAYDAWLQGVHPEDREHCDEASKRAQRNEQEYDTDFRVVWPDGSIHYLKAFGQVMWNPDGKPLRMIGVNFDITRRRRAELELQKTNDLLSAIINAAPTAIIGLDLDGKVQTVWNQAAETMFGWSAQEAMDKFLPSLPVDQGKEYQGFREWIRSGQSLNGVEVRRQKRDGTPIDYSIYGSPLHGLDGQIVGNVAVLVDITDRKLGEEKIRRLNQELEQRVLERTLELENANKELDAFAHSISHDLRAPLRHIDGFLQLLQARTSTRLDEKSQHYMANISEAAQRMGFLIDDLLSFSRMSRTEMISSQVDLNELVQDILGEFKLESENRDIEWDISGLPLVTGDRAMLRIVFVNLISNALKFTRARSPAKIQIGWVPDPAKGTVVFVRDNGVGFDMKYIDKLFGVFQRLHRADEFEGTGIGLANVQRIIDRHGGETWAEGKVDQGAAFYFSLPASSEQGKRR